MCNLSADSSAVAGATELSQKVHRQWAANHNSKTVGRTVGQTASWLRETHAHAPRVVSLMYWVHSQGFLLTSNCPKVKLAAAAAAEA